MIHTLNDLALVADYSLLEKLSPDPKAKENGVDHAPRQVFSGHYVPVNPTPIPAPHYIAHSTTFFQELELDDALTTTKEFIQMFSGDLSNVPHPMRKTGWATGYALSIYGSEYYQQCPFGTGNGYGDGRAISIFEGNLNGQHWEMQLKGGGATPYCRGADGRAVLRSSIREFLVQEHMNALEVPTSRSLCLYTSKTQQVRRPWFREDSHSRDPEVMIEEDVAITTRVAPSFLRVGQIELFGRRARKNEHPSALQELETIVLHLIDREYRDLIDPQLPLEDKILILAREFRNRLTSLVADWIRVGYCQGNFNSDNCAAGGFTLDYGPFGFIELFDPNYQPWTGGGEHFSFFNQPNAAKRNFDMLCLALRPLLESNTSALGALDEINKGFSQIMGEKMETMLAKKLGLESFDPQLFSELLTLMVHTGVDYTIFFRELSNLPQEITPLLKSFYNDQQNNETTMKSWSQWLEKWNVLISSTPQSRDELSQKMKRVNPKYILREWLLVSAYQKAQAGDYSLVLELQEVMLHPYDEQSSVIEEKYYQKKPSYLFDIAGVSHISCSS